MTTNNKELISPSSGTILVPTDKQNIYYDKYTQEYFRISGHGKILDLEGPDSGARLVPTENECIFYDKYIGSYYILSDNGKLVGFTSPISGLTLTLGDDGYYSSGCTDKYIFDKDRFVPMYIPDDTLEDAHIEGDYLVGNNTGRRFPINDDGSISMPYEPINIPDNATEEEINLYMKNRKLRQLVMSQEEIDQNISDVKNHNIEATYKAVSNEETQNKHRK